MQVIQTKPGRMRLLGQEQDNLPKVVPNKAVIRVSRQAPEREPDQLL